MNAAIIILNYLTWKDTIEEVQQIKCNLEMSAYQIIIVDNCSPNESAEKLEAYAKEQGLVFLQASQNQGYAVGNNIGLRYAYEQGYEYALVLNNDIILSSDILSKLQVKIKEAKDVAVISPKILSPTGYEFNCDSKYPTFFDLTFGMLAYRRKGRSLKDEGGWAYIYRPQGCCMLVDLQAINEVGYMDERTFLYCEEMILAERLLAKGYRVAMLINDSVIHNHSKTIASVMDKRKRISVQLHSFSLYLKEYRHFSKLKCWICKWFMGLKLLLLD